MEARMMGEVATAPEGKRFQKCYDVATVTPTGEYVQV
jgi:methylamine--corrinoid protein Co-methyltransferase